MKHHSLKITVTFSILVLVLWLTGTRIYRPVSHAPLDEHPTRSSADAQIPAAPVHHVDSEEEQARLEAKTEPSVKEMISLEASEEFRRWFQGQAYPLNPAAIAEGRGLLETRREAISWMIHNAPEMAMEQALSYAERERLPDEWQALVEERFSEIAKILILPDCSENANGAAPSFLLDLPGKTILHGRTWGEMVGFQSKNHLPVEGISLDGWSALEENGIKRVSGLELAAVERLFPLAPSAKKASPGNAAASALVGGQVHCFAAASELSELRGLYAEVAALPGPHSADPLMIALADGDPRPSEDIFDDARDQANSWTETPKTVLVLNTIFPDKTTPVGTQAQWQSVMSGVSDWLSANSYGKTNLVVTVPPNVFMMPSPVSTYEPNEDYPQIMSDAKALAQSAGYDSANYDITVVAFPQISWSWSGRGSVGGGNQWLNGNRNAGVIAHELGHNYGLWHASSWDANDGSVMPASGTIDANDPRHVEYGDLYSIMGSSGGYPSGDYSPHGKAVLNWIIPSQVETVSSPGTYRIYRFDHSTAGTKPRLALKLQRANSQTFWLGYRRNFTGNSYISNGAYLLWEYNSSRCRLLDMTPDSKTSSSYADKEDAALALGQTFADPTGLLYITPIAQGGTAPDEWLDVQVEFNVAGNHPPSASITVPPAVSARSEVTFSATASDPDNDPLTYVWDFGNNQIVSGQQVSWTFEAGGSHQISVRVTDGKGGLAEVTETITVSDPLAMIEEIPLLGSNTLNGGAHMNGLHLGVSYNNTLASPDGTTWHNNPNSSGFDPGRLAFGAGRVVSVGQKYDYGLSAWISANAVTTDAMNWTVYNHSSLPRLNGVAFGGGVFAAVGDDGTILTSLDGNAWTSRGGAAEDLYDVIAVDSGFVACGRQGSILTSSNGDVWTQVSTPATWPSLRGLATDGVKVGCVGLGGDYWWSEDGGLNWQSRSFGLNGFSPTMFTFGEGLWVAVGSRYISESSSYELMLAVSQDGSNWGLLPLLPNSASSIRIADGRLLIYGQAGKVLRSGLIHTGNQVPTLQVNWPASLFVRSGTNLTASTGDANSDPVNVFWDLRNQQSYDFGSAVNYRPLLGGSKTLTAWASDGRGGHSSSSHTYLVDEPLLYWSDITPSSLESASFFTAACGNGRAVIAGGSVIAAAPENEIAAATAWTKRSLPSPSNWNASGVAYRAPGFVAVGNNYDFSVPAWRSAVRFSSDGQTWSAHQFIDGTGLNAVAAADGAYVAIGGGGVIVRSTDGQSWSTVTSGTTNNLNSVAFVGARGLAVGNSGALLRSENSGATWVDVAPTIGDGMSYSEKVHATNGYLFITGSGSIRRYDPVSRLWQDAVISGGSFGSVQALVRHGAVYVAIAERYVSSQTPPYQRYLLVSEDGLTWEAREFPLNTDVSALISCNGSLVAAGSDGILANVQGLPGLVLNRTSIQAIKSNDESGSLGTAKIFNSGAGTLAWSSSSDAAWLGISDTSGNATFAGQELEISLLQNLATGTHQGTITFSASGVPDRMLVVTVNIYQDDHSNIKDRATTILTGSTIGGNIQTADDSDWFAIKVDAPGTITVWTTGTLDTLGELHGTSGRITSDDDSGEGSNFLIERLLLPGQYWVKVDGYSTRTGEYSLHTSFVTAGPRFVVTAMVSAGGGAQWSLTAATAIGYRYHVEESSTLDGVWTTVGNTVTAETVETVFTVGAPNPRPAKNFYRIAVEKP